MSNTIGNAKDLDASRTQALQRLLSSLGHTNEDLSTGAKLSTDQFQKLSDKISEILGDGSDCDSALRGQPSQLISDPDGLPIFDISEPVNDESGTCISTTPLLEQDFTPFSLLSPGAREQHRRERDRILDVLEEEERIQQLQEERDAEEERMDTVRKRKESARAELDQLKAAQELQKKMGQALVGDAKGTRENRQEEVTQSKSQIILPAARKSVSFADSPIVEANESDQQTSAHQPDWGGVTPGKLRTQGHPPLMSKAEAQNRPIKMRVVERHPTATPTPFHDADSDDESTSSIGHLALRTEDDSSGAKDGFSSSDNDLSDNEPLEEEFDYDTAQHYREVALEYHKKRHAVGAEATKAMAAHTLGEHEHGTSNERLPLSRFRVDRMAAAYDKSRSNVPTSIGQNVIPVSRQKLLRNSVRLGKLEGGQLGGGDSGESGSDDDAIKEIIQMLQAGSTQNAGPDFKPSLMSTVTPLRNSDTTQSPSVEALPATHGARPSRFKLAHGGTTKTVTRYDNSSKHNIQTQPAISNVVERRVPRSSPARHYPISKPPLRSAVKFSEVAPPMVIDSPSFPLTANTSSFAHSATLGSPSPHER